MDARNNTYDKWEDFKRTQQKLIGKRNQLIIDSSFRELVNDFFKKPSETSEFLTLCSGLIHLADHEIIKFYFPEIVEIALLGNPTNISIARIVIKILDNDWLKNHLDINIYLVLNKVESDDEEWAYRRTVELLKYIGFDLILKTFLEKCKAHPNPEIVSLYDDYFSE